MHTALIVLWWVFASVFVCLGGIGLYLLVLLARAGCELFKVLAELL